MLSNYAILIHGMILGVATMMPCAPGDGFDCALFLTRVFLDEQRRIVQCGN
jgi:hypothetical protein